MKIIDEIKNELIENIFTHDEIDKFMEVKKYYPIENDEEYDEIFKYTNNRSEIWVKYIYENEEFLVCDVTMKTKKTGKTKVRALKINEIKLFMDYFRENRQYDDFMIFISELLLARRIGDILSLKWSYFYYENGNHREYIKDLIEEKTDKIAKIYISPLMWKYIDWYCEVKNINPVNHLNEDIFSSKYKNELGNDYTKEEYYKAVGKQAKAFRYQLVKAADELGINGVSTHSLRKTFGHIAHEINQFDPDCLDVLQSIYVHESKETTKIYIDIIDEKASKFYNDVGKYVEDIDNGITPAIDNVPVIALKTNDLRDILLTAYNKGLENKNISDVNFHMQIMNDLMSIVEKQRLR